MDLASDELDAADVADELDLSQEEDDGYDGDPESAASRRSQQPRVSVRAREDSTDERETRVRPAHRGADRRRRSAPD